METNKTTQDNSYLDGSVIDTMISFAEARKANVIPLHQSLKIQLSPESTQGILSKKCEMSLNGCSNEEILQTMYDIAHENVSHYITYYKSDQEYEKFKEAERNGRI